MTTLENRPNTALLVVPELAPVDIRATLHGAFVSGYDATLVSDARISAAP